MDPHTPVQKPPPDTPLHRSQPAAEPGLHPATPFDPVPVAPVVVVADGEPGAAHNDPGALPTDPA